MIRREMSIECQSPFCQYFVICACFGGPYFPHYPGFRSSIKAKLAGWNSINCSRVNRGQSGSCVYGPSVCYGDFHPPGLPLIKS